MIAAWHAAAAEWPLIFGANDADSLDRQLHHEWDLADSYRGSSPLFRRTWPEWRPGMGDEERFAFDRLLAEEGEAQLAGLPTLAEWARTHAARRNRGGRR